MPAPPDWQMLTRQVLVPFLFSSSIRFRIPSLVGSMFAFQSLGFSTWSVEDAADPLPNCMQSGNGVIEPIDVSVQVSYLDG